MTLHSSAVVDSPSVMVSDSANTNIILNIALTGQTSSQLYREFTLSLSLSLVRNIAMLSQDVNCFNLDFCLTSSEDKAVTAAERSFY